MSWVLASVALVLALVALARSTRPPAPAPGPAPGGAPRPSAAPPPAPGPDGDTVRRLARLEAQAADLEGRLAEIARSLAARPAPPAATAPDAEVGAAPVADGGTRVRRALEGAGYDEVLLLEVAPGSDRWRVEARRGGLTLKGEAHVARDGSVHHDLAPAFRAFP